MSMADATKGNIWLPGENSNRGWGSTTHWSFTSIPWLIAVFSIATVVAAIFAFNAGLPVITSASTSSEVSVTTSAFNATPFWVMVASLTALAYLVSLITMRDSQTAMAGGFGMFFVTFACVMGMVYFPTTQTWGEESSDWLSKELGTSIPLSEIMGDSKSGTKIPVLANNDKTPVVIEYTNVDGVRKLSVIEP